MSGHFLPPTGATGRSRRAALVALGAVTLGLTLAGGTGPADAAATRWVDAAGLAALSANGPSASPKPGGGSETSDGLDPGVGDDGSRPSKNPKGNVSFGVRPAGAKAVDLRTTWTYQKLTPGQVVTDHVAFVNLAEQPTTFTIYAADAQNTATGGYTVAPSSKASKDLGTWITLPQPQVTVPARSTVIMSFQLKVPRNVEPGDHAGGIVASYRTFAKNAKGNTVAIDSRVGSRVYARVEGALHPRIQIDALAADFDQGSGLGNSSATVHFTVRNSGNVRLQGHQSVRIFDFLGGSSQPDAGIPDLPELLPNNSFSYSVHVKGLSLASYFTAQVTVDPQSIAGNVDPVLAQTVAVRHFLGLSYPFIGFLLVLLALVIFLLWRRRRARHPRPRRGAGNAKGEPKTPVSDADHRTDQPDLVSGAGTQARESLGGNVVKIHIIARRGVLRVSRDVAAVTAAAALALGFVLAANPAQAAPSAGSRLAAGSDGTVTFVPAKGQDVDPMYAVLSGPCPAEATNTVGALTGKGFPPEGISVVPSSRAGMRHDEAFGVPLQNSLHNFAAMNGVKFEGDYVVTIRCVDHLSIHTYATFTGVITFSDSTHFTAKAPATPPNYGVPLGVLVQTFPSLAAAVPSPETAQPAPVNPSAAGSALAAAGGSAAAAAQGQLSPAQAQPSAAALQAASGAATPAADSGSGVPSGGVVAVLAVIALVGGVSLMVARNRRSHSTTTAREPAKSDWPDQERV